MTKTHGVIFDIRKFSLHDGPGIRTTVFFKGCPLSCQWCHNPESQSFQTDIMLWDSRCIGCGVCANVCSQEAIMANEGMEGKIHYTTDRTRCIRCGECIAVCAADAREMIGRQVGAVDVMREIERDRTFYEESGGGVTFSGGEPLAQAGFLAELLQLCKRHDIHTAVDTCGYAPWSVFDRIRAGTDLFLYDLKLMDDARHRHYTGVSNQRILQNVRTLSEYGHRIIIRMPVVPGINDDLDNLTGLGMFAASLPNLERLDVLPYHPSALGKYDRLAQTYSLPDTSTPTNEQMDEIVRFFDNYGLPVKIGG